MKLRVQIRGTQHNDIYDIYIEENKMFRKTFKWKCCFTSYSSKVSDLQKAAIEKLDAIYGAHNGKIFVEFDYESK